MKFSIITNHQFHFALGQGSRLLVHLHCVDVALNVDKKPDDEGGANHTQVDVEPLGNISTNHQEVGAVKNNTKD